MNKRDNWGTLRGEFGEVLTREMTLKEIEPDEPRDVDFRLGNWLACSVGDATEQLAFLLQIVNEWSAEKLRRLLKAMPSRRAALASAVRERHAKRYHPDTAVAIVLYFDDAEETEPSGEHRSEADVVTPARPAASVLAKTTQNPVATS